MKYLIISLALLISTIATAQNSLFNNISTTDQYVEYFYVDDPEGDGTYVIKERRFTLKFYTAYLSTGEGYQIQAIVDEGNSKDHLAESYNTKGKNVACNGHPYESLIIDTDDENAFVSIGDYVFQIYDIGTDGTSFKRISKVYIKKGAKAPGETGGKKKSTLKDRLKTIKGLRSGGGGANYGPEHSALQKQNLDKMITDYLVAMKAKQDARTSSEKQSDANIKKAKAQEVADEKREWEEIKIYNDSIKATPKYAKLKAHQKRMEGIESRDNVTLRNNSGNTIYVGRSGSRNPGSKIAAGGTIRWNCDTDAYLQTTNTSGGNTAYNTTDIKLYSSNSGCGSTVDVN